MPFVGALPKLHLVREGRLQEGPHLARARTQAAVVRALLDEVERRVPAKVPEDEVRAQLYEELGRLSSQVLETAPNLVGLREE